MIDLQLTPGYHIFWEGGDSVQQALTKLQNIISEAEKEFDIDFKNFSCKGDERRCGEYHAIQVVVLTRKPGKKTNIGAAHK